MLEKERIYTIISTIPWKVCQTNGNYQKILNATKGLKEKNSSQTAIPSSGSSSATV